MLLGRNEKLGLSGRKSHDVGILSTSKLYTLQDRIFAFTPQVRFIIYKPLDMVMFKTISVRICKCV